MKWMYFRSTKHCRPSKWGKCIAINTNHFHTDKSDEPYKREIVFTWTEFHSSQCDGFMKPNTYHFIMFAKGKRIMIIKVWRVHTIRLFRYCIRFSLLKQLKQRNEENKQNDFKSVISLKKTWPLVVCICVVGRLYKARIEWQSFIVT